MAIFGFICGLLILGYITFALGVMILFGGEEFSLIDRKHLLWLIPIIGVVAWLWWMLLTHAPFSIIIS